jgi:hemoglobin/transferrin/lactoferrin receptor protein
MDTLPRAQALALGLGLFATTAVSADRVRPVAASETTETMVVTGSRRGGAAFEQPFTNVVTREVFTHQLVRTLPEALAQTPGVMVQKSAQGSGSPFLRGFTGYRTLTLIDGVRYNNSVYRDGPNEYFSLIDSNVIERIELLSGPASVLYGSDAVGGTLNLQTRTSRYTQESARFLHAAQDYRYGTSDDSHLARTDLAFGAGGTWGVHVGYSVKDFGDTHAADLGRQRRTGYGEHGVDFRLDGRINPQWDLTIVHQNLTQDDVWRSHATVFGKSFASTTVGADLVRSKDQARSLSYVRLAAVDLTLYVHELRVTASWQTWDEDAERVRANRRQLLEGFDSRMWGADLALATHFEALSFSYGVDYYRDNVESRGAEFAPDGALHEIKIQGPIGDDASYGLFGAYLQAEFEAHERLLVTAGSRYTETRADIGRFEDPSTGRPASFAADWTRTVHSLRAIHDWVPAWDTKLWAGVSQAFRAPNIADLSRFGASRSNEIEIAATTLEPEDFLTYEIGVKTQRSRWQHSASYYYTRIHDFITSTPTGRVFDNLTEVSKANSSSGFVHGVELAGQLAVSDNVTAFANLTWLEGRLDAFETTASLTRVREPLSRIMPLTGNFSIEWASADRRTGFGFAMTVTDDADHLSAGDTNDTERIPPGGTPGYVLINLRACHQVTKNLELNFALENVFDEAYRTHGSGTNEPGLGLKMRAMVSF